MLNNRFRVKITYLLLWLSPFLLIGHIPASGLTLCWGEDGHIGIETDDCHHTCCMSEETERKDVAETYKNCAARTVTCGCFDIAFLDRQFSPVSYTGNLFSFQKSVSETADFFRFVIQQHSIFSFHTNNHFFIKIPLDLMKSVILLN